MRFVPIAGLSLLLAGCAQQTMYIPPTGVPLATIQFENLTEGTPLTVLFYDDGITCKGKHTLAFANAGLIETAVDVPAGRPFTFTLAHFIAHFPAVETCNQTYTFTPDKLTYMVSLSWDENKKSCHLSVEKTTDATKGDAKWMPVTNLIKRKFHAPFSESGAWCKPLSQGA